MYAIRSYYDSYTIRFKDSSMFLRGKNEISDDYKKIFNQFFPRYLEIIGKNIDKINTISIQGHTSSRYRTAKTQEEKFEKNRVLSQKRADTVRITSYNVCYTKLLRL